MPGQAGPGPGSEAPRLSRSGPLSSLLPACGEKARMRGGRIDPLTHPSPRMRGEGHAFPGHDAPKANTGPHSDPTRSTNSERYKRENVGFYSDHC
jgi:hypothetical protein